MSKTRYTRRDIAHMHRIYRQTMSLAATAKVCGCHVSTVAKYRDLQGWITPQQIGQCTKGNDTTLTPDIAMKLAGMWRLHLDDKDICWLVGITTGQLKQWLYRNAPVTIIRTITRVGPDGKPLEGEENVTRVKEAVGLRDLRERERASLEYTYNQKLVMVIEQAIQKGDLKTAGNNIQWLMAKKIPQKYAESGININMSQSQQQGQASTFSAEELDLPLETCKQILAKIREKKQLNKGE